MYVCMYVCIYMHIFLHMYVCMYAILIFTCVYLQFPNRLTIEAVMKVVLKTNQVLSPWSAILVMKGLENIPLATYPNECSCSSHNLDFEVFNNNSC